MSVGTINGQRNTTIKEGQLIDFSQSPITPFSFSYSVYIYIIQATWNLIDDHNEIENSAFISRTVNPQHWCLDPRI